MTTLKLYQTIIHLVTAGNNLAARLRDEKISKEAALEKFRELLDDANEAVR